MITTNTFKNYNHFITYSRKNCRLTWAQYQLGNHHKETQLVLYKLKHSNINTVVSRYIYMLNGEFMHTENKTKTISTINYSSNEPAAIKSAQTDHKQPRQRD